MNNITKFMIENCDLEIDELIKRAINKHMRELCDNLGASPDCPTSDCRGFDKSGEECRKVCADCWYNYFKNIERGCYGKK